MADRRLLKNGIPISLSLGPSLDEENIRPPGTRNKKRTITISFFAFVIAVAVCLIAKFLLSLIDLVTNLAFYGKVSLVHTTPAGNHLGWWVVAVPVLGGVIVGLMALYGSKAIRGHGIPEAMEQILTNQSKIKPTITYLKPLSSAIAIGTGGPFGAEGPIIATGGALGSTFGQLLRISANERKILLAAGATAGMSFIFGSPIAAMFLAIELLLFEFSPRSIIPISLACITGGAGHHFLFGDGVVFELPGIIAVPSNVALLAYSIMGALIGVLSVLVTKIVYAVEDLFEKLPVHWMWWPAIGGIAVGLIGVYAPSTMGVGYENITQMLSGNITMQVVVSLCLLKFISWAIALGSGTSGGTLAPLLTIGGATGILIGSVMIYLFPSCGITLPLAALTGMAAMFAGASRALLTSIIFSLETTSQANALLPLLGSCTASYFVSFFLMENTIMTEKIARRGVRPPHSYEPDVLEKIPVKQVIQRDGLVLSEANTIGEVRTWLDHEPDYRNNFYIVAGTDHSFRGIISSSSLFSSHHDPDRTVGSLIRRNNISIPADYNLRSAVELMAKENVDVLPVLEQDGSAGILGILSYKEIISAYRHNLKEHHRGQPAISIKRRSLKILSRGKKMMEIISKKD